MNDYKELIGNVRICVSGDCCCCILHGNKINCQEVLLESAADAIEQLVNDYEILAKMYAKVNEDLCVRTKERDAAVADLKSVLASECGLNQCRYCKYQEEDGQCHHDCIMFSSKWGWEWRGVKEDNDEID